MDEGKRSTSALGICGVAAGVIALVAAVLHFWVGPLSQPQPIETSLAEIAVGIRDAVEAELRGEDYQPRRQIDRSWDADQVLDVGTAGAGLLAILLAVVSFIRREDLRVAGSAVALGDGAIAFQFAAVAVGMIVAAILIAAIVGALGISPG